MRKIIIASHHKMASGLSDTLQYIAPNTGEITVIDAYLDNTPVTDAVAQALAAVGPDDEALVFTDLLGGSVNQAFTPYLAQGNVHLITGMNLPVILTLILSLGAGKIEAAAVAGAVKEAREQLLYVNDYLAAAALTEEDE